jgi:mono/diheme cytochrome c family protein
MRWVLLCIAVLSVALICVQAGCSSRKSEPLKGKTLDASNSHVKNGEETFMKHCQKCHPGGEGGLGPALNSNSAPQFVKRFQVRHGLGVMPSFTKDEISKADLHDISAYLKTLKSH